MQLSVYIYVYLRRPFRQNGSKNFNKYINILAPST